MTFFYNLAFMIFGICYLPVFLMKIKQAEDGKRLFKERMGIFPASWCEKFLGKKVIWVHAVSVGEVMAVQKFLGKLQERCPGHHIVLTTVTPTGQKIAKKMENQNLSVCYFPFDLTFCVRNFFRMLGPRCLLLVETEIWPNLLTEAKRFHVPVGLVNARLSNRAFKRYRRFQSLFRGLFSKLDFVLTQGPEEAKRFSMLGVSQEKIHDLGNMKFDNLETAAAVSEPKKLKKDTGFNGSDLVLMAGSTHAGEEEMLGRIFLSLKGIIPSLKLLIAPRHIERCPDLLKKFVRDGIRTQLATDVIKQEDSFDVLILNRLGVLRQLYAFADIVFVGGSLIPHGGQNPIEPAAVKKAILHGPFIFNFEHVYRVLDQEGAALLVRDEAQLEFAVRRLMQNPQERLLLGETAFDVISSLQGATDRHLQWISCFLETRLKPERMNDELHAKLFSSSR